MRSIAEYLGRAAEFEKMAASTTVEVLRRRYADIAACYRLLAKDREWLINTGALGGEETDSVQKPEGTAVPEDQQGFGRVAAANSERHR